MSIWSKHIIETDSSMIKINTSDELYQFHKDHNIFLEKSEILEYINTYKKSQLVSLSDEESLTRQLDAEEKYIETLRKIDLKNNIDFTKIPQEWNDKHLLFLYNNIIINDIKFVL